MVIKENLSNYTSFYGLLKEYPKERVESLIYSHNLSAEEIRRIIFSAKISLADYAALLSPNASELLDELAYKASIITRSRFGRVIRLYAPLYLSNFCVNSCLYCGFNRNHKIERRALTLNEVLEEVEVLKERGIDNILLVMGDNFHKFSFETLIKVIDLCKEKFSLTNIELPALTLEEYITLKKHGVEGLTLFQETFIEELYPEFHLNGPKADYKKRLNTPELACKAGYQFITLGALLGLGDFRVELFYLGLHTLYLQRRYPHIFFSASFPRIRNADNGFQTPYEVSDRDLIQLTSAYRLLFADNGINISTRESAKIRDILIRLSATIISADSKTSPGGYKESTFTSGYDNLSQFEISDKRSTEEICATIRSASLEPLFKYW